MEKFMGRWSVVAITVALFSGSALAEPAAPAGGLKVRWKEDWLTISGPDLPGREMRVHYLEAYCRPGSTNRDWKDTVIGHVTRLVSAAEDGRQVTLECTLKDGAVVRHEIRAGADEVDFRLTATNPTTQPSQAHWAQPCIRLDAFTGGDKDTYLQKCFIFQGGKLARMPTADWATKGFYTPGQEWRAPQVDPKDVNPRPLNPHVPDKGLIGCYSADESRIFAVAFEPYQELFQGVAACLHSDFRIGGLAPGETKNIRGKIYIVANDVDALLKRYRADFPEQVRGEK
jgi:hypothetical protein